jgi:PKD repeat protein
MWDFGDGTTSSTRFPSHSYQNGGTYQVFLTITSACDQLTAIAANTDDVEFLLTSILNTLQASTEYEAKFVVDTCDSDKVYLEVRVWDTATSTWGPISYYIPGSDVPVTPVGEPTPGCLQYADPGSVLGLILAELQSQTAILIDIEADTTSIDATLTSILTAYSAGQQACASSLSVTLCTEQGQLLTDIEATLSSIDTTTSNVLTELLDQGVTLDDIETVLNILNSSVATELTLQAVLTELQGINIDTNGLSQEATQLLVLAALNTVISNTTGLATEVTLDALLTAFNAEDFATEATLSALNVWVQANAATEATLLAVDTKLTPQLRTHNTVSTSTLGSVPAGSLRGSVLNVGSAAGVWNGASLPAGVAIPWDSVGNRDTYGAINFDATGTTFIIEYTT